jgi:hypothetical protein
MPEAACFCLVEWRLRGRALRSWLGRAGDGSGRLDAHEAKEVVVADGPTDPRLELTIDDLITISAAVAIALPTMNAVDRIRYQALATELARILIRTRQVEDGQQADGPA